MKQSPLYAGTLPGTATKMIKTLIDLIEDYQAHQASLNFSPLTLIDSRHHLLRFQRWMIQHAQVESIDQLRADHLRKWRRSLMYWRTAEGRPLKAAALNRHVVTLRGFFSFVVRQGLAPKTLIEELPYLKEPQKLPGGVLSHAQMRKLLARVPTSTPGGYRNRAMLELLYSTGVRVSELLGLNVADVDLDARVALVRGKGRKERVVPIGRTAARHLETYLKAIRPYLLRDPEETALFVNEHKRGKRLSYATFATILKAAARAAGLDMNVTPHTFRRSCATELIRGGANMYHVKELLGHESLDTLQHYVRLTINDLKKTHEKCHPRERDEGRTE